MTTEQTDPYAAPTTVVHPDVGTPGSAIVAVIVGLAVDVGGSFVLGIAVMIMYVASLARSGVTPEQLEAALMSIPADSPYAIVAMVIGCGLSALGGYLCARISKQNEYRNGAILASLSMLLGFLLSGGGTSLMMNLVYALATLAAVMIGTWFGVSKNARTSRPTVSTPG